MRFRAAGKDNLIRKRITHELTVRFWWYFLGVSKNGQKIMSTSILKHSRGMRICWCKKDLNLDIWTNVFGKSEVSLTDTEDISVKFLQVEHAFFAILSFIRHCFTRLLNQQIINHIFLTFNVWLSLTQFHLFPCKKWLFFNFCRYSWENGNPYRLSIWYA